MALANLNVDWLEGAMLFGALGFCTCYSLYLLSYSFFKSQFAISSKNLFALGWVSLIQAQAECLSLPIVIYSLFLCFLSDVNSEGRDHAYLLFDISPAPSTVPEIQQLLNKYLLQEGSVALG